MQYQTAFERLGAKTIVLSDEKPDATLDPSVHLLTYDPHREWQVPVHFQVNVAILFGQMFGFFSSQRRSLNVDDPSVDKACTAGQWRAFASMKMSSPHSKPSHAARPTGNSDGTSAHFGRIREANAGAHRWNGRNRFAAKPSQ